MSETQLDSQKEAENTDDSTKDEESATVEEEEKVPKKIRITERDVQIAKAQVKDFQTQANNQLQLLQTKVKEASSQLLANKAAYMGEVKSIEGATGLSLKDWTVDDDRILRPIEETSTTE